MNSKLLFFTGILCFAMMFGTVVAQEAEQQPDAKELVKKADLLLRGESSSVQFSDFVIYRPGKNTPRKILVYLKGKPLSFMHVVEPVSDRDITLLKRDYDLWMYTPKVRKSVRIPPANMHEGVLGSDFTYDDIIKAATLTDDYEPSIIGVSKAMEKEHGKVYVVDLTPLPGRPIAYKKLRLWIRENGSVLLRQQYYNEQLEVTRVMVYSDIREMGGRVIPTTRTMVDIGQKGHYTVMKFHNAAFNTLGEADDQIFAPRSLTTPPKPLWE